MRHGSRTVNEAFAAFDLLDSLGVAIQPKEGFVPAKHGGRTFGQFEALENKLTSDVIDGVLTDGVKPIFGEGEVVFAQMLTAPKAEPLTSFFQATKVSESANSVIFHVRIKRGKRTPQQLLDLTGRRLYTNSDVVSTMPLIGGDAEEWEGFDFEMFKVGRQISDAQVEKERTKRQLTRDLEVQALINAQYPEFADQHPNGDSWQDADSNWCFASFYRGGGVRVVFVSRDASGWDVRSWFGGRKVSK